MLASNLLDIIDDIVYRNCCISVNEIYNYRWLGQRLIQKRQRWVEPSEVEARLWRDMEDWGMNQDEP